MLWFISSVGQLFVGFLAVVLVHTFGHYYAARSIVGIPASEIRLQVTAVPLNVAFRDDEEWLSPVEYDRYRAAYDQHDPDGEHFERFVAAGDLFQTGLLVPAALVTAVAGFPAIASLIVVVSLLTTTVYVVYDVVMSLYAGAPRGTYSALWTTMRLFPVVLLAGIVFLHLGVFHFV